MYFTGVGRELTKRNTSLLKEDIEVVVTETHSPRKVFSRV